MRWKAKDKKPRTKEGDERAVRRFLFLPKCLRGQWRWLEFADIQQRAAYFPSLAPDGPRGLVLRWVDIEWIKNTGMVKPTKPWPRA